MVERRIPHDDVPHIHGGTIRIASAPRWLHQPATRSFGLASSLDAVRRAPTILSAIRLAPQVRDAAGAALRAGTRPALLLEPLEEAIRDASDTVTAVAAIHALGEVPGRLAEREMAQMLSEGVNGFDAHAAWTASLRPASPALIEPLTKTVARGGLAGMHAQHALARWASQDAGIASAVLVALDTALRETGVATARRYLAEVAGLVPGPVGRRLLERLATDASEASAVRVEAVASLGDRVGERLPPSVTSLASQGGPIGEAVRQARARQVLGRRGPRRSHTREDGLKIAQVHLGAVLDAEATRAGVGDAGGVATLLPRLGAALAAEPHIHEIISVGRALPGVPARTRLHEQPVMGGHCFENVALEEGEGATFAGDWPSLVAAERGIRAALLASGTPDVLHLRIADPGSLAAARVAHELGIPTVFTLAPDPHGPIAAAERRGTLDRRTFGTEDARSALWYRVGLVARFAHEARELVLFPRPDLPRQLAELVGIDLAAGPPRHTIVAEGVDTQQADEAAAARAAGTSAAVLDDLVRAIERLPEERQGLPIVVSVGRLHDVKGMARIVEAIARDPSLGAGANLVLVGGDLDHPNAGEAAELARINVLFHRHAGLSDRVILLGHRRHAEAGLLLAVARHGWGDWVAPGGAYVCGSPKEEFGLAILEAMAAGLPVVAPLTGGPATYIEPGVTGALVDTTDPRAIAAGIHEALHLAADPATGERTRSVVDARFTLSRMAHTLAAVYRIAAGASTLALTVEEGRAA
jgi:glycosyltransferase involved in cell wall biosynthesis